MMERDGKHTNGKGLQQQNTRGRGNITRREKRDLKEKNLRGNYSNYCNVLFPYNFEIS